MRQMGLMIAVMICATAIVGGAGARPVHCGCGDGPSIPTSSSPDWSPDGRQIVFSRYDDDAGSDIYVMRADGSRQRMLFRSPGADYDPDWSPDGRRIAFVSYRDDNVNIYVINADGTGLTQLTIYVMRADGSDQHRLVADDEEDLSPAWSPDGSRIAFEGGVEDSFVDVMSADGTNRVRLTFQGRERSPAWSPDGKRIAFRAFRLESDDIYLMNPDGSDEHLLVGDPEASDREPSWSPDGARLAFSSTLDDTKQIYVAGADGSKPRRLTGIRRAFTSTGERCTVVGTARADLLKGTSRDDNICGLGGNDTIRGLGGSDILDGGPGDDLVDGGAGVDILLGAQGNDLLLSRDGKRDDVDGGPGRDRGRVDPNDWVSLLETLL